ncbi:NADP-dependent oxidoreductase [Nocardia pseudobrasiliensis]|uniref:NADPH:quinone reductase-like Zn-dependent oxidoreductase n=1 Tax=Nocardia pseudobrasiliensis TaxID=45979 RepID=A0A370I6I9_9NOCA|nr:NADP-dependent oxidoreductase [Nocardia pseudobrasiliensis]RDI66338.1 NADPH:quinone reductase-like Zn-dependent oxidoreductase [Nocardia pseudobrasiliensis]
MPRIVRPTAYGTPDVLTVTEAPTPSAAADGVVVEVRAAGVNPIDWKLYSGAFHDVDDDHKDAAGLAASMPSLGLECAGVVTEVGAEVTDVRVGDEVIVYPVTAAYADYITAPADALFRKPAQIDWAQAGALMLTGTTAVHALHAAGVGAGDTVLVHGGSGGVGLMAVQLATAAGATVIATAAERNHALLRELGATPVVYGPGLADRVRAAAPQGVTAAVDFAGTDEALDVSLELVADRDRISSITGSPRRAATGIKSLGYGPGEDAGAELRNAARGELVERAGSGALRVIVDATFPLAEAAKAHEVGIAGHAPGKLVLIP